MGTSGGVDMVLYATLQGNNNGPGLVGWLSIVAQESVVLFELYVELSGAV